MTGGNIWKEARLEATARGGELMGSATLQASGGWPPPHTEDNSWNTVPLTVVYLKLVIEAS